MGESPPKGFDGDMVSSFLTASLFPLVRRLLQAVKVAGPGAGAALSNPGLRAAPGAPRFEAFMYAVTSVMGTWSTMSSECSLEPYSTCR